MAPYTWLRSRIVGACLAQLGHQMLPSLVVFLSLISLGPKAKRQGGPTREGIRKTDSSVCLPGFSPMCDEMMLLPTCWNWREDELVGHNARAGHLFPHAMAASGEGGFLPSIFSAQPSSQLKGA
ncbi:hypothetical protein TRIATDRAFT_160781 [Trichoderma atroviride IMI 206040]|uniref:Uncharacterized protein n=1 Tax=Hypocrea atroviridis (strain ATCC 20476 / IMI 206040) TaxID=452589 RepID=G9NF35_HYPAI|nr:uncharacterized protein TRIATDRAFT_160781 [Trichoderma atroviride IMI 206040]EHK50790.1 hypothetical protein TRIATDRAFT_160781 [Trichoderma atroviride IMI 206040]